MNRQTDCRAALCLLFLLFLVPLFMMPVGASAQQPSVSLSASTGFPSNQHRDWLLDRFPLSVTPSQNGVSIIRIDPAAGAPFALPYTGRLTLRAYCCTVPGTAFVVSPGMETWLGPSLPERLPRVTLPDWVRPQVPPEAELIRSSVDVNIAGQPQEVVLTLKLGPTSIPGNWEVAIQAEDRAQRIDQWIKVLVHVLPAWPGGPGVGEIVAACPPRVETIGLSFITPNPYKEKARNPGSTPPFNYGIRLGAAGTRFAGLQVTIRDANANPPLAPTEAIITFRNTQGWPTAIRKSDSRNCATTSPTMTIDQGRSVTLNVSVADTTTLFFSASSCRAVLDWFDCWGRSFLGLDDIGAFGESAFWLMFGGRAVDIETVGDWRKAYGH